MTIRPKHLDLQRDRGLTVQWANGTTMFYSLALLRHMSPSAEQRELRESMERNPLTVLPASRISEGKLEATGAELVGNYAIRIRFSDGHDTGIFSWRYLQSLEAEPVADTETT